MEDKYTIYLHRNIINQKCYVGQTKELNPTRRWRNDGSGYKSQTKFYNAIQKYGWENFEHIILDVVNTIEEANQKEQLYIILFDSYNNGYNADYGGKNAEVSFEEKLKISESLKKYNQKHPEAGQKHSKFLKEYYQNNPKERIRISNEQSERWKDPELAKKYQAGLDKTHAQKRKAVRCKNNNMIFNSITEAAKWCGLKNGTGISTSCKNPGRKAGRMPETKELLEWEYYEP